VVAKRLASDSGEPALRIYLAGGIAVVGSNGTALGEAAFAGRQGRRLFARLVAIHEPVPIADLADDLWGPEWPPAWQVALRSLVSKLRTTLGRVGAAEALASANGAYALALPAGVWLDLDEASAAMHRAEAALAAGDHLAAAAEALVARSIASRTLLPGEEAEWLDLLRARLTEVRLRALESLGEVWIARGDPALAARDAAEAIRVDPYRERAHRLLIRAHIADGDRGAAAQAYEACRRLLAEELGVEPSSETRALVASVLRS